MSQDARKALDRVGLGVEEWVTVAGLPVGLMQFVEIAREIDKTGLKLLVFDEPTAVLTESEADNLIAGIRRLAESGIAILFITHRLNEVLQAADNISILRDGELVGTRKKEDTSVTELAELMVGRRIDINGKAGQDEGSEKREIILDIRNLHVDMPGERVRGVNLEIYEGEIFGIGGLAGQGKVGIANGVMGLYPAKGEVLLKGEKLDLNNTKGALNKGLAFVSEDRRSRLLLDSSIELNIVATTMHVKNKYFRKLGFLNQMDVRSMREHANRMIKELDIRCTGPQQLTRQLSAATNRKSASPELLLWIPTCCLYPNPLGV